MRGFCGINREGRAVAMTAGWFMMRSCISPTFRSISLTPVEISESDIASLILRVTWKLFHVKVSCKQSLPYAYVKLGHDILQSIGAVLDDCGIFVLVEQSCQDVLIRYFSQDFCNLLEFAGISIGQVQLYACWTYSQSDSLDVSLDIRWNRFSLTILVLQGCNHDEE